MTIGSVRLTFNRTDRVPDDLIEHTLPPGRGSFKVFRVSDYHDKLPGSWDRDGIFLPIHDVEAMWIGFGATNYRKPNALLIGAGGINAITGQRLGTRLQEGNYLVVPPQPWIDGWKTPDGSVRQFVATFHKAGKGLTVAEQLIGTESTTGALGIATYELKNPLPEHRVEKLTYKSLSTKGTPKLGGYLNVPQINLVTMDACLAVPRASNQSYSAEMGLGAGGSITQKIYPDPYGLSEWKPEPTALLSIYFVDAISFGELIGVTFPKPLTSKEMQHPGFKLHDGHLADNPGSHKFKAVKSVLTVPPALKTGAFLDD